MATGLFALKVRMLNVKVIETCCTYVSRGLSARSTSQNSEQHTASPSYG